MCFISYVRQNQLCVSVLGVKRSNIVTIALSSLPPTHLLPPAIYSMDSSVLDREDVQVGSLMLHCLKSTNIISYSLIQDFIKGKKLLSNNYALITTWNPYLGAIMEEGCIFLVLQHCMC